MPTDWKSYIPIAIGLFIASVVGLFALLRADAVRAGEPFPTKLALAQTFSALRNGKQLLAILRGNKPAEATPAPREFRSVEEMKATITPGTLRAEDIPSMIADHRARKSPVKSDAVE